MKRVVLDMDPGIDDAIALLLAINSPVIEVAAVTTVSGNVSIRKGTKNALRVLEAMSTKVPVYMGASHPEKRRPLIRAEDFHGSDGLGEAALGETKIRAEKMRALDMFTELLKSSKRNEITIVATGPLTNIANLVAKEPSLVKKLDRILLMGGLYDPSVRGNVTEYSEFNFFSDAESADRVMRMSGNGCPDITAVGLELTSDPLCIIDKNALAKICEIGGKTSEIACKILRWPVRTHSYFNLHDVFALFALIHPEIFLTEACSIRVAHTGQFRGMCRVIAGEGKVHVCRKVDQLKFNQFVLDGLK